MLETYFGLKGLNTKNDDMLQVILDQEGRLAFTLFARGEYSVENLLCLFCIYQYRHTPSVDRMKTICETFITTESSPVQVNLPRLHKDQLLNKFYLKNAIIQEDLNGRHSIFDAIIIELLMNLSDTFCRFAFTEVYQRWTNNREWSKTQKSFAKNAVGNLLVTGGATLLLGPAVAPLLSTVIGFKATKNLILDGIAHREKKKAYADSEFVKNFKSIRADRDYPIPRLPWSEEHAKILDHLNASGFDMTVAGYPKKPRGLCKL